MPNTPKYKCTRKDIAVIVIYLVLLLIQIGMYIIQNGITSVDTLFTQTMIFTLGFVGVLDFLHCINLDILVPDYILYIKKQEREKELSECMDKLAQGQLKEHIKEFVDQAVQESLGSIMDKSMDHVVEESMADVIEKSTEAYFKSEINYIKNYSNERINHVLSQLKLKDSQFNELRLELIRMRSLPLKDLKDAEEKIKEFIRSGHKPFNDFSKNSAVVNLKEINSAKRTYNNVDYFLNFHDAMYSADNFADFVRVMNLLICEKIGADNFDTIAIPFDSNVILGVEVAKLFGKPVVKMRKDKGKLEIDHLWDGEFGNGNRVLIVHDVLVSGEQIIHVKNHIPSRFEVVALCCLAARTDDKGLETLKKENIRVERVIDLSDSEIESLMEKEL